MRSSTAPGMPSQKTRTRWTLSVALIPVRSCSATSVRSPSLNTISRLFSRFRLVLQPKAKQLQTLLLGTEARSRLD